MKSGELLIPERVELVFPYEQLSESIVPELKDITDRMVQTERGREQLNNGRFRRYLRKSSKRLTELDEYISSGVDPRTVDFLDLNKDLRSVSPLIELDARPHVVRFFAEGLLPKIDYLESQGKYKPAHLAAREVASLFEELSIIHDDPYGSEAEAATYLNDIVKDSEYLNIGTSPRKLYATLSFYDLEMRRLRHSTDALSPPTTQQMKVAEGLRSRFFYELGESIAVARKKDPDKVGVSGSINEDMLHGFANKRIYQEGKQNQYQASQSLMRHDRRSGLESVFKVTHDVRITDLSSHKLQRVEVKKNTPGATQNGSPSSYLTVIDVVALTLGKGKAKYLELAEAVTKAEARSDDVFNYLNSDQDAYWVQKFLTRVDSETDRIFEKLRSPTEIATDYNHRV